MAKDKPPHDPDSSPGNGDWDESAPKKNQKLFETAKIEDTTPLFPDEVEQTADDVAKSVANEIDVTNASFDPSQLEETADEIGQDEIGKTVANKIDATVANVDSSQLQETTQDISKTVANELDATVASIDPDSSFETLSLDSSPITEKTVGDASDATVALDLDFNDTDVTRTINPRELSKEGEKAWGNLTSGGIVGQTDESGFETKQKPVVERSFTETKLFIRDRNVAAPKDDPNTPSDYRLIRMLGKGGMGNVYVAKQGSLDRLIAVKVIRPLEGKRRELLKQSGKLEEVELDRRHQFLSEAVVTGDLDHPNIVPIHDIAVTSDNTLFYAMKRVVGTPWSKVIHDKSRDENIDILLKVCDAIGFAHTRGVVHRDIKPENIMLGDFGVVMVMDWGLALPQPDFEKIDSIAHSAGLGGTPAFMAPEMATGPLQKIGAPADIYLLGATLFYIVTGTPPHHGENVSHCLKAVTSNAIREVEPVHRGELLQIALKAMATDPKDRYADVREFQDAIRQYRSHAESVALACRAVTDLQLANQNQDYAEFSRARFGFEQSLSLWEGNAAAKQGLADTLIAHATAAHDKEDFDLGLSLLDANEETHHSLIEKLHAGRRLRQQRASRLRLFKTIAAAMLAFILLGGSFAVYLIDMKRQEAVDSQAFAEKQRQIALFQEGLAKEQEQIAKEKTIIAVEAERETRVALADLIVAKEKTEVERDRAKAAERIAEQKKREADLSADNEKKQREVAVLQTKRAEYETYLSQIGLAKARIESNEFDDARRILGKVRTLRETQAGGLAWEWRWLWRQANQSTASPKSPDALIDLALATADSGQTEKGIAVLANGSLQPFSIDQNGRVQNLPLISLPGGAKATAIAFSDGNHEVAVGTTRGDIQILDRTCQELRRTLKGHESRVTKLQFVDDSLLVSGSIDKTARIWNTLQSSPLETCWHIAAVRDLAAKRIDGEVLLATAVADSSTGRAVVWSLSGEPMKGTRRGDFLSHDVPVASIALSPDGKSVASGDVAGNLFVWPLSSATATDYSQAVASVVKDLANTSDRKLGRKKAQQSFQRMVDPAIKVDGKQLVSTSSQTTKVGQAHDAIIESVRFSQDGKYLITASDDYTLKVWDHSDASLQKLLRGHGGWVTDAVFVGNSHEQIVSVSNDTTIRRWDSKTYVGSSTTSREVLTTDASQKESGDMQKQAHADEVWSARFDSTGNRVVTASRDHSARVLEVDPVTMAFSEIATIEHDDDRLSEGTAFMAMSVAMDRDHGRLFVGSADATIRIWDLENGNEVDQATGTGLNSSFALSSDGSMLLTGSSSTEDKAILWQIDPTGKQNPRVLWRIKQPNHTVTAFAISADNTMFFTGDRNGLGYLWSVETGQPLGERIEDVDGYRINAACFSADSRQLLIAADDEQVTRIDIASRKRIGRLKHDGFVTQLSLSKDGTQAVTVSEITTKDRIRTEATRWDLGTEQSQRLHLIESRTGESKEAERITAARFGDQSRWIIVSVAAAADKPARVMRWDSSDLNQGNLKPNSLRLPQQLGSLQSAIPIGNQRMITLNGDSAFLWDLESMSHVKSYRDHGAITQAAFSHDDRYVVTASRSVKIWDATTGRSLGKLESPHEGYVRSVDFNPNKFELATGGDDGFARRWSWNPVDLKFQLIDEFDAGERDSSQTGAVTRVLYSPDGISLLVAGASGMARLWSVANVGSETNSSFDIADAGNFTCAAFSADGNWIVLGSDDKIVRMVSVVDDGSTRNGRITFEGHADQIEDVAVIQDASHEMRILTASRDKSARVWDPRIGSEDGLGREVIALRRHTQGVTAVDATSDGSVVMTAGRDGAVILWPAAAAESPQEEASIVK